MVHQEHLDQAVHQEAQVLQEQVVVQVVQDLQVHLELVELLAEQDITSQQQQQMRIQEQE